MKYPRSLIFFYRPKTRLIKTYFLCIYCNAVLGVFLLIEFNFATIYLLNSLCIIHYTFILIVYFEDKVKGFLKSIPLYFMNAWFDRLAKLKFSNFGHLTKISQLEVLSTSKGIKKYTLSTCKKYREFQKELRRFDA
jgi:hypothetical protein